MKRTPLALVTVSVALSGCLGAESEADDAAVLENLQGTTRTLTLVDEKAVYRLLPGYDHNDEFEASGITRRGDYLYVVFDERQAIGRFHRGLYTNSALNTLIGSGNDSNHEAITLDSHGTPNFYVAVEAVLRRGKYYPHIKEYDEDLDLQYSNRIDYEVPSGNKGFEGLAWLRRDDEDYLLGMFESDGTIVVLQQDGHDWDVVTTIDAPVGFGDYSDLAVDPDTLRVAITSQLDGKLWVGALSPSSWAFAGTGVVYDFPADYDEVEGVTWLDATTIATCTDKGAGKEQSVQIFRL